MSDERDFLYGDAGRQQADVLWPVHRHVRMEYDTPAAYDARVVPETESDLPVIVRSLGDRRHEPPCED